MCERILLLRHLPFESVIFQFSPVFLFLPTNNFLWSCKVYFSLRLRGIYEEHKTHTWFFVNSIFLMFETALSPSLKTSSMSLYKWVQCQKMASTWFKYNIITFVIKEKESKHLSLNWNVMQITAISLNEFFLQKIKKRVGEWGKEREGGREQ